MFQFLKKTANNDLKQLHFETVLLHFDMYSVVRYTNIFIAITLYFPINLRDTGDVIKKPERTRLNANDICMICDWSVSCVQTYPYTFVRIRSRLCSFAELRDRSGGLDPTSQRGSRSRSSASIFLS